MEKKHNVFLMLILFYPIGIYGMLKHEHFNKVTRITILVFFGFVTLWLFQIAGSEPDPVSQEYNQEELEQIVAEMPRDAREELVLEEIQFAMQDQADVRLEGTTFTYVPNDRATTDEVNAIVAGERGREEFDELANQLATVSDNMMFILGEGYTHQLVNPNDTDEVYMTIIDGEVSSTILDD